MKELSESDWFVWAFRSMVGLIGAMVLFYANQTVSQLTVSIDELTKTVRSMSEHLIDSDRRIAAIEVSRSENMSRYYKALDQVDQLVRDMDANKSRIGFIERVLFPNKNH